MGLPIFITPVEPEVASRETEKAAAGPRSSIRRQRTIRGGSQARASENRRRRIHDILENEAREQPFRRYDLEPIRRYDLNPNEPEASSIASLEARANRFFDIERMVSSEPLSWERHHRRLYPDNGEFRLSDNTLIRLRDGPLLPPAPDPERTQISRVREMERLHQVRRDIRRMGRRRPAPTPPYTETDIAFIARTGRDSPRPSSLTPALSPSQEGEAEISSVRYHDPEQTDFEASFEAGASRTLNNENHSSSLLDRAVRAQRVHAFNHTSTASIVPRPPSSFRQFLQQARLDGLGDRDRSPEGGEAWDTLLTSITPDPQPPSAGSSFASSSAAAAAAAAPPSNSVPMWREPRINEVPNIPDCDEPTSSDSNTEDDDEELEDLNTFLHLHRREPSWRSSYADVARANHGAQSPDTELEGMQRIISRLAERDDIPESWWASVGLRREASA